MKKLLYTSLVMAMTATFAHAATGENWMTDFEAAKKKAAEENKDLLVDFTGSDWCGWCIKLDKEVFSEDVFKKGVDDKFVLVSLDYPRDKSKMSDELQKQNEELQKKFQIQGFPTILLMDAEGKPYARTGYQAGGPEKYLTHLDDLRNMRTKRDESFAKAAKLEGVEKAKALVAALDTVPDEYKGQYEEVMTEIIALDPKDVTGFAAKENRKKALMELQQETMMVAQTGDGADAVMAKIDAFIKDNSIEGEEKQEVMALKINPLMATGKFDETIALLDEMAAVDPESELAARVKQFKPQVIKMKEASAKEDGKADEKADDAEEEKAGE